MPPGKGPLRGPVHMASPCAYRSSYPSIPSIPPKRGGLEGYPRGPNCPILGTSGPPKRPQKGPFWAPQSPSNRGLRGVPKGVYIGYHVCNETYPS